MSSAAALSRAISHKQAHTHTVTSQSGTTEPESFRVRARTTYSRDIYARAPKRRARKSCVRFYCSCTARKVTFSTNKTDMDTLCGMFECVFIVVKAWYKVIDYKVQGNNCICSKILCLHLTNHINVKKSSYMNDCINKR